MKPLSKQPNTFFPSFLAAITADIKYQGIQFFADTHGISALWLETNHTLPKKNHESPLGCFRVKSPPLNDNEALTKILRIWAQELKDALDVSINQTLIQLSKLQIESSSSIRLILENYNWQDGTQADDLITTLKGDTLFASDVRDATQIQKIKAQTRISNRLWRALQCSGIFAILMGVLAIILFLGEQALEKQKNKLIEQASAVGQVKQKEALLESLDLFSVAALQPFEALERMNRVRPDALYFTSLTAGAHRQAQNEEFSIKLKAVASSAAQADKFSTQLQADAFFSQVRLSKLRSKPSEPTLNWKYTCQQRVN